MNKENIIEFATIIIAATAIVAVITVIVVSII